jgi:hypothetical protein
MSTLTKHYIDFEAGTHTKVTSACEACADPKKTCLDCDTPGNRFAAILAKVREEMS